MRALLDVNVLIALLDQAHPHHDTALTWLRANIRHGWASCPITQNGVVRIMSQPGYPTPRPPAQVAQRLGISGWCVGQGSGPCQDGPTLAGHCSPRQRSSTS